MPTYQLKTHRVEAFQINYVLGKEPETSEWPAWVTKALQWGRGSYWIAETKDQLSLVRPGNYLILRNGKSVTLSNEAGFLMFYELVETEIKNEI